MDDAGDMEVPDCATDGSCPEDGGGGGDDEDWSTPEKEPATLLEETQNALQQFSIGLFYDLRSSKSLLNKLIQSSPEKILIQKLIILF